MNRAAPLAAAIAMVFTAPSFAQNAGSDAPTVAREDDGARGAALRVTDILGQPVYAAAGGKSIGEISDVLVTPEGRMTKVLVGVGGFLGVGRKVVALSLDTLTIIPQADDHSEIEIVSEMRPEVLKAIEPFTASPPPPTSSTAPAKVAPSEGGPATRSD